MRPDGRRPDELRPLSFEVDYIPSATGSVLVTAGSTRVICTAMVEESVPGWMRGKGAGWVTAEYGMLPGSTGTRKSRDAARGKVDGRTVEIQRLIGRALRAVCDRGRLGERTVWVDCDVIQADGGTRCAAISGGYVALHRALATLVDRGLLAELPLSDTIAAISVGIVDGLPVLDLPYVEDVRADTDMNVVMTGSGRFVEVQGTAEAEPFSKAELDSLLALAERGIDEIRAAQLRACAEQR
jgi:ribonuclease PH